MKALIRLAAAWAIAFLIGNSAFAQNQNITLAGLSYSGDAQSLSMRFPYSIKYENQAKQAGNPSYLQIQKSLEQNKPQNFEITSTPIEDLKGRDQALVVSLMVNSETVSIEEFGQLRKLFVLIRGQALFFDFKSMSVLRSYPLSFAYIDTFSRQPSEEEILARVKQVYEGTPSKPGIFGRFAATLHTATLPQQAPRFLQVTQVKLSDEASSVLPQYLKSAASVAETWAADLVSEAISTRLGVPIIPYSKGYAIGNVMSMQVSDGSVFNLKLPQPDYEISVDLTGFKKIKYGEVNAGASFIYGSYASIKIEEPLSGKTYLNTALKNGEIKVVPATQTYVDDFPAFYDSINGLFGKLSEAVSGKGNAWIKTAAAASDIEKQITQTRDLMNLCK